MPGHAEHEPWRQFQHLEKRYFEPGVGFGVVEAFGGVMGMAICNDRRWPETYRVMGLQGVEMVMIGYNTPVHNPPAPEHDELSLFHNHLVMQAGAYQNGTWVVGVAKAGVEEGVDQIGGSCIIAPSGEVVAACTTKGDEIALARCDLDLCNSYKRTTFNFDVHRQPQAYRMIVERKGRNHDGRWNAGAAEGVMRSIRACFARLSIRRRKDIPLYRNSEMSYMSAIPAILEGRSYVVTICEPGCGGRGSVVRERCGQGG